MQDNPRRSSDRQPFYRGAGVLTALLALTLLSGCASLISASRETPIEDSNEGRSFGRSMDDQWLETKIRVNIKEAHPDLAKAHIVVETYNGIVLIAGQVPREELIPMAEEALEPLRNIRAVHNYLKVAGPTSTLARGNDAFLSTKVSTQLKFAKDVDYDLFNVVTEDSVVYLLGVVDRAEADRAVDLVSKIGGVRKIVKVIEYVD